MRDQRPVPDRREHVPGHEPHVEHGDAGAAAVELHQARLGAVRIEADLIVRPGLHLHRPAAHREPQRDRVGVLRPWRRLDVDRDRLVAGVGEHLGDGRLGGIVVRAVDQLDPELLQQLEARPIVRAAPQRVENAFAVLAKEVPDERRDLIEVSDGDAAPGEAEDAAGFVRLGEGALDGERPHRISSGPSSPSLRGIPCLHSTRKHPVHPGHPAQL